MLLPATATATATAATTATAVPTKPAAATATAATAVPTKPAAATRTPLRSRPRLVNRCRASAEVRAVERIDCSQSFRLGGHFDEGEPL